MRLSTVVLAVPAVLITACTPAGEPEITNAWIRAMPPNSTVTAGYMSVTNDAERTVTLVAAESPMFGRVEFHMTRIEDGVARMLSEDEVVIPGGETVNFEPGGRHLMLFDANVLLVPGDRVPITLRTKTAGELSVTAEVRGGEAESHDHH